MAKSQKIGRRVTGINTHSFLDQPIGTVNPSSIFVGATGELGNADIR